VKHKSIEKKSKNFTSKKELKEKERREEEEEEKEEEKAWNRNSIFWVNELTVLYVDGYNRLLLASFFRGYGITNKNRLSSIKFQLYVCA
jgi:hypothetical protein